MSYLFSSESVSQGHPDKVSDQISDALLDQFLAYDENAHCAIETFCTTGQVVIMGEVTSEAYIDLQTIARKTINRIGYTKSEYQFDGNSCGILSAIHEQSRDISRGVTRTNPEDQGAGDQGMMFGYATVETDNYMPVSLELSHLLVKELSAIRKEGKEMQYLRPDSKSQVTIEYADGKPVRVDTVVISTQHHPAVDHAQIENDIKEHVIKPVIPEELIQGKPRILVNPTGRFVMGGPQADSGLTGRKIIVDTYGGAVPHGGGAFSGKDPTKVDRSGAYMARYAAKNVVAAGLASSCQIQVAYAIGVAHPVSIMVETFGTGKIADEQITELLREHFDFRPAAIIRDLELRRPQYKRLAAYGHMGRIDLDPMPAWERTDKAATLKNAARRFA